MQNKIMSQYILSFHDYMEKALYDKNWGYYSTGTVDFEDDFQTEAEMFAPLYAERCFLAWKGMVEAKVIDEKTPFHIYEFGAGTGVMASIILKYTHGMALKPGNEEWKAFYNQLQYHISEISPALQRQQAKRLEAYIKIKKASVHLHDARKKTTHLPKGAGMVLSNELIDAFPVQKIEVRLNKNTDQLEPYVRVVVPTVTHETLGKMIKGENREKRIQAQKSKMLAYEKQWGCPKYLSDLMRSEGRVMINLASMESLLKVKKIDFSNKITMSEWSMPLTFLNEAEQKRVRAMLKSSEKTLKAGLKRHNKTKLITYFHTALYDFLGQVPSFLKSGYVMTVDYGLNAFEFTEKLSSQTMTLNTFSKAKRNEGLNAFQRGLDGSVSPNCMLAHAKIAVSEGLNHMDMFSPALNTPGKLDMTIQVNFSDMAKVGEVFGIQAIHLGAQDSLGGYFLNTVFRVFFQEYGVSKEQTSVLREHLLKGMKKSMHFDYNDMPGFAKDYVEISKQLDILVAKKRPLSWGEMKSVLDWMLKHGYKAMDRAEFTLAEECLFGPRSVPQPYGNYRDIWGGVLTRNVEVLMRDNPKTYGQCVVSDGNVLLFHEVLVLQDKLLHFDQISKNEDYAFLLLSMIAHNRYHRCKPEHERYLTLMDSIFNAFEKLILEKYPKMLEEIVSIQQMKDLHFANLKPEQKKVSHLTSMLRSAEQDLKKQTTNTSGMTTAYSTTFLSNTNTIPSNKNTDEKKSEEVKPK